MPKPKTMTEAQLAERVAKDLKLPKSEVRRVFHGLTTVADKATDRGMNVRTPLGPLRWRPVKAQRGGVKRTAPDGSTYTTKPRKAGKKLRLYAAGLFRKRL
jgi:hypothetical protein